MDEKIPIPIIKSYYFSLEQNEGSEFVEWSKETIRAAGMYGIALGIGQGRTIDIATNIFESDGTEQWAAAATKHQLDSARTIGYTSPILIVKPNGGLQTYSSGRTPGQL